MRQQHIADGMPLFDDDKRRVSRKGASSPVEASVGIRGGVITMLNRVRRRRKRGAESEKFKNAINHKVAIRTGSNAGI